MSVSPRHRLFSYITLGVLCAGALAHGSALVPGTGSISGTVTAPHGTALSLGSSPGLINVSVYDSAGTLAGSLPALPPTTGTYTISNLSPGTYFVATSGASGMGYIDQVFSAIECASTCVPTSGTGVPVTDATPGTASFVLRPTTHIAGVVRDTSGNPIGNITVQVYDSTGVQKTSTTSAVGTGAFLTPLPLAPGSYFIRTNSQSAGNYFDQLYPNLPCGSTCNVTSGGVITLAAGTPSADVVFSLEPAQGITGKVTDANGNGIAGVSLRAFDATATSNNSLALANATSSSASGQVGNYSLGPLRSGTYFVVATGTGFFNQLYSGIACTPTCTPSIGTPIVLTGTGATANITMAASATIIGTVRNRLGFGLGNVTVRATDANNTSIGSALTDSVGSYTIRNLSPGSSYFLRTSNTLGYFDQVFDGVSCLNCPAGTGTPLTATLGTQATADFVLDQGAQIRGTVTDAVTGVGLPNVSVRITGLNGVAVTTTTTNAAGVYTTTGVPAGTYFAVATAPVSTPYISQAFYDLPCVPCVATQQRPFDILAVGDTIFIDFPLQKGGRIMGTVTDAVTNAPLSSVAIDITDANGTAVTTATSSLTGTVPGTFTTTALPDGKYFARAHSNANATVSLGYISQLFDSTTCAGCDVRAGAPVTIANGQDRPGVDFRLTPGARISGRVSAAGQPIAGVPVTINAATALQASRATTNATGDYTSVDGFPAGTFYASVSSAQGFLTQLYNGLGCIGLCVPTSGNPIVVAAQDVTGIDFALSSGGRVSGMVTNAAGGAPLSGTVVQLLDLSGNPVATGTAQVDGTFTTAAVTAGNYFVRTRNSAGFIDQVHHTGANVVCAGCDATLTGTPVAVAAGSVVTGIDFAMQEGGRISGTVIGPGGTPVQNAQVLVFADPTAPVALFAASGTTDRLGRYVVGSGLPAGSYYARTSNSLGLVNTRYAGMPCTSECSLTLASPIAVNAGIVTSGIDFVLTADDDADQDGIASSLDTSTAASNAFSDLTQGGSTSGVITDRAGWSVNVTAAGSSGVKAALAGTGTGPAILQTCATNSAEEVRLLAAGDAATIQCSNDSEGRTSVRVVAAASFVELRKTINGLTTVIELATGQVASIGSPVVADGGNLSSIRVRIEDASGLTIGEFSLDPGESAAADKAAGGLVSVTVLTGTVDVTLQGTEQTLRPGDVASVAACARIAIESISATPAILGPANHKMVSVKVYPILSGTCGRASWEIVSVTSNEPVDGLGDGDTSPDWEIGPDRTLFLRAERSGAGTGRTYTVTVRATDESGNVALKSVTVTVKK